MATKKVAVPVPSDDEAASSKDSPKNAPKKGSAHGKAHRPDWHNVIDVLAFMIGLLIFLYPLISSYVNYSEQTKAIDTYDAIVSKLTPSQRAKM